MIKSLQTTVDNWVAGTSTGQTRYEQGVASTDKDPTQLAIQSKSALLANFNSSVQNGVWERRLAAAGKAGWQAGVANGGGAAWSAGITAKKAKFQSKIAAVLQVEAGLQQQIDSMPSGTPAANDARMLAWANGMRQAKANGAFG